MQGKGRRGGRSTKLATDSASTSERLWVYQGYSKVIRLEREIDEVKSRHNGTLRVGGCRVRQSGRTDDTRVIKATDAFALPKTTLTSSFKGPIKQMSVAAKATTGI